MHAMLHIGRRVRPEGYQIGGTIVGLDYRVGCQYWGNAIMALVEFDDNNPRDPMGDHYCWFFLSDV